MASVRGETLKQRRILVVEDDIVLRMVVAGHLRKLGGEVDEAGSIAEARRALQIRSYHAVVTDVHLPDGRMIDLVHEIRARDRELQFIFITGDSDRTLFEQALRDDPAGYLIKPFELLELDAVLVRTLEAAPRPIRHSEIDIDEGDVTQALEFLGAQRVVLRAAQPTPRHIPVRLYAKLAGAFILLLLIAFAIGYLLHDPQTGPPEPDDPGVIFIPVQPANP